MLNENLRKARINKNMSQEQLALQMNVVRQTISKWEKGTSVPDAHTLVQLSEILELPVEALLGENQLKEPPEPNEIARQLARMNDLTALKMQRSKENWAMAAKILGGIAVFLALAAILPRFMETCREFGKNLYHALNP